MNLFNRHEDHALARALEVDEAALDEAVARWRRGEKREALHQLENALGRDFSGLGDLKPEDLK